MKFALLVVVAVMTILTLGACSQATPASPPPQYDDYRAALMAFVDANGLVDYAGLKDQRSYLDDFVTTLEQLDPKAYEAWSENDKIALWINAYNALTIRAVIDHYPINPARLNGSYPKNSIRQLPGEWDFNKVNVMGQSITLGYIETKILRRDFHEPRVYMAIVPGALASPMLRNEPYEGAKLDAQLDDQARKFMADPRHFQVDRTAKEVRVSEIFRRYVEDFATAVIPAPYTRESYTIDKLAGPYLNDADRAFLRDARVRFVPYDWTLNQQPQ